jgi:hypothetical protein
VSDPWIGADHEYADKMLCFFHSHAHAAVQDKSEKDDAMFFYLSFTMEAHLPEDDNERDARGGGATS